MIAFAIAVYKGIFGGRVLKFAGETLRQAGVLVVGSVLKTIPVNEPPLR